jgi:hypothetical protein
LAELAALPDFVKVGALTYQIVEDPRLKEEGDFARIRLTEAVIQVATPMHPDVTRIHVLHEVIHAMLHDAGFAAEDHEERIINALSHGLVQLVRDNPGLIV